MWKEGQTTTAHGSKMYGFLDFLIRVANICQKQGKGESTSVHSLGGQKSITAGTVYGWRPHGSSPSHISPRQEARVGYPLQGLLPEKRFLLKISQRPSQGLQLWAKLYMGCLNYSSFPFPSSKSPRLATSANLLPYQSVHLWSHTFFTHQGQSSL